MASHLNHAIGEKALIRLRIPEDQNWFPGEVEIRSSRACDHVETMCSKCVDQWRQDWIIAAQKPKRSDN